MKPDTSRWRDQDQYEFYDALPVEGVAWECLRRNASYQACFDDLVAQGAGHLPLRMTSKIAGGCDFPADPGFSALDQPVIWSPVANPDMLMLGAAPDFLPPSPSALSVDFADAICGPEGTYGVCDVSDGVQYLILADTDANSQPAIILPLDQNLPDRLEAILRLWHMLAGKPARRDPRMTPYQRRRFRLMMQAADGNANHATYREIAIAIYGEARVRAEPWKTSALRASVIALVRSAAAVIDGGYQDLLRHRRKP